MKLNYLMVILMGFLFSSCLKREEVSASKAASEKQPEPEPMQVNEAANSKDRKIIEQATEKLKDPILSKQIKAVRDLRKTYTLEACRIIVAHLKEKEKQLPASLNEKSGSAHQIYLLDYLGALIEEIRSMNQPEGNEAVSNFMNNFRAKYGNEKIGQAQLAIYESQLKNVEIGIKEGYYKKKDKKKTEEFRQMIGGGSSR